MTISMMGTKFLDAKSKSRRWFEADDVDMIDLLVVVASCGISSPRIEFLAEIITRQDARVALSARLLV